MKVHVRCIGKSISILLALSLSVGCATIIGKGSPENLNIRSTPDQATIVISDENGIKIFEGKTPTIAPLEKKKSYFHGKTYTVTISKEGFVGHTVTVDTKLGGWYIGGNLIFGGLIGWLIVDPATGAMWTLDRNEIDVTLGAAQGSRNGGPQFGVVLLQDVPASLREKMAEVSP